MDTSTLLARALGGAGARKQAILKAESEGFEQFRAAFNGAKKAGPSNLLGLLRLLTVPEDLVRQLRESLDEPFDSLSDERLRLARAAYDAANDSSSHYSSVAALGGMIAGAVADPLTRDHREAAALREFERGVQRTEAKLLHARVFDAMAQQYIQYCARDAVSKVESNEAALPEKREQRETFERIVFQEEAIDTGAVAAYLDALFKNPERASFLNALQEKVKEFCNSFFHVEVDTNDLKAYAKSLSGEDLLTQEKKTVLEELCRNDMMLKEVADVLSRMIKDLPSWKWSSAIPLEMRRQLNGKYRIFMDEELCEALMLHIIGSRWCAFFKENLDSLMWEKDAWMIPRSSMSSSEQRACYGAQQNRRSGDCVASARFEHYKKLFFLNQLPKDSSNEADDDDDENGNHYDIGNGKVNAAGAKAETPAGLKQLILRLFVTETQYYLTVGDSFYAAQTDFEWFGPSLPHKAILAVMKRLGVTDIWLNIFKEYLSAPLYFQDDFPGGDGGQAACVGKSRRRQSGVPMSHRISTLMGELVLTMIDLHVNQATQGEVTLYRLHDDVWFWHPSLSTCVAACDALAEGARVFGLELNSAKSGSLCVSRGGPDGPSAATALPAPFNANPIRWGFLIFDPAQKLRIDETLIAGHISEMCRQLQIIRQVGGGVLALTKAWNVYFSSFLAYNFGPVTVGLGPKHIEAIISNLVLIHDRVVAQLGGATDVCGAGAKAAGATSARSFVDILRANLPASISEAERRQVLESFFWWPAELGGAGLLSPLVDYLWALDELTKGADEGAEGSGCSIAGGAAAGGESGWLSDNPFSSLAGEDLIAHRKLEKEFRESRHQNYERLIEFAEFTSADSRAFRRPNWKAAWERGIALHTSQGVTVNTPDWCELHNALSRARDGGCADDRYVSWLALAYGQEVNAELGSFAVAEPRWAPLYIVQYLRAQRMLWAS